MISIYSRIFLKACEIPNMAYGVLRTTPLLAVVVLVATTTTSTLVLVYQYY